MKINRQYSFNACIKGKEKMYNTMSILLRRVLGIRGLGTSEDYLTRIVPAIFLVN